MNFLNIVKNYLPAGLIQETAKQTGESESSISKLISAAIPTVLGGLISKSSSDSNGIFSMAQSALGSNVLGNLGGILGSNESSTTGGFNIWTIIKSLFGDKLNGLVSSLAGFAGVKESSAQQVFGLSSAASLGALGAYAKEHNLDASGLSSFLASQKSNLTSWMPAGFDFSKIAGSLGLGSLFAGAASSAHASTSSNVSSTNATSSYNNNQEPSKKGGGWVVPVIILAALAGLIWWFSKSCNKDADTTGTTPTTSQPTENQNTTNPTTSTPVNNATLTGKLDSIGNWVADWGTDKTIKLADGTELKVGENSTEYKLYNFITNPDLTIDTVDKTKNWYSFDRVYFQTGKSILTETSQAQVKNIALILKNYPTASIKIGGYTDNTGDAAKNKTLSAERAKIVSKELVKFGANAKQVVEAEGYGPEHPIATNDTEEGKAQNRRVDLKVASK